MKLRLLAPDHAELIPCERSDAAEVRSSSYTIARTPDPRSLLEILSQTLGTIGVVRKTRLLDLVGQTRVHIDQVDGLGDVLELQGVMREGQSEDEGR